MMLAELIDALADGSIHSGADLGRKLSVSRSAIWKAIAQLNSMGLDVIASQSKGYRLARKLELLNRDQIVGAVSERLNSPELIPGISTFLSVASTNTLLSEKRGGVHDRKIEFCFAEHQTAGRGRRGKDWISPFGANLSFSLIRRFDEGYAVLQGLSLAIGVIVSDVLAGQGIQRLALKWPNDILVAEQKLCGVLIELSGEHSGPVDVVIGVGINIELTDKDRQRISQRAAALSDFTNKPLSRNVLAAELVVSIVNGLSLFERERFSAFRERWYEKDYMLNRAVSIAGNSELSTGIYRGVDHSGCALVESGGVVHLLAGGEISLRVSDADATV
jgi:BirA family biotin operon repressor/biotin-[acetyl-CoA-carboxylase] ligase